MPRILTEPRTPLDAFRIGRERGVLPTSLGTQEIREELAGELRSKSVFSARVTSAVFLEQVKLVVNSITGDERGEGDERVSGMSLAEGRVVLREALDALGYTPEGGFPDSDAVVPPAVEGTLQDLRSRRRLNLIIETQAALLQGAGQKLRGLDVIDFFPAWELVRFESAEVPRDWEERFDQAGGTILVDEDGRRRLVAHKNDPVWDALGDSALFDDALDVDHPPFAFTSGMGWREVRGSEWRTLGGVDAPARSAGSDEEKTLLPANVASVSDAGTRETLRRDFDGLTVDGLRVKVGDLRDLKRARLAAKYGL